MKIQLEKETKLLMLVKIFKIIKINYLVSTRRVSFRKRDCEKSLAQSKAKDNKWLLRIDCRTGVILN